MESRQGYFIYVHILKFPTSFIEKQQFDCFSITMYLTSKINFNNKFEFTFFIELALCDFSNGYIQINITDANLLINRFLSFHVNNTPPFHHCLFPKSSHATVS